MCVYQKREEKEEFILILYNRTPSYSKVEEKGEEKKEKYEGKEAEEKKKR